MPNEQNLIPFNKRTEEEQREIQTMGGRASGVSRRRKRALKEAADMYLAMPVKDKRSLNKLLRAGVDEDDADNQMLVIAGLVAKAAKGDAKAARLIFDLIGEGDASETHFDEREDDPITRSLNVEFGEGVF